MPSPGKGEEIVDKYTVNFYSAIRKDSLNSSLDGSRSYCKPEGQVSRRKTALDDLSLLQMKQKAKEQAVFRETNQPRDSEDRSKVP